jgi:hypothetical protein
MRKDRTYQLLLAKMHEVASLPTQDVGPFTNIYKVITANFKNSPYLPLGVVSLLSAFCLYLIFGSALVRLATLLQFGF